MERLTTADIARVLEQEYENDVPDQVLEVLRRHAGKQLTKRLLKDLPGGESNWHIRHIANMTNLENRDYFLSSGNAQYGVSLLMAYGTVNVVIDPVFVEERNTAYFRARQDRNTLRVVAKNSYALLGEMAMTINLIRKAREELDAHLKELDKLTGYGATFSADSSLWKKLSDPKQE